MIYLNSFRNIELKYKKRSSITRQNEIENLAERTAKNLEQVLINDDQIQENFFFFGVAFAKIFQNIIFIQTVF